MIVVDTSAVLAVLAGRTSDRAPVQRLTEDGDLHAPHLIDIEVLPSASRSGARWETQPGARHDVRTDVADLTLTRYGHEALADRVRARRDNRTACDAVFVSLSEALDVPPHHL